MGENRRASGGLPKLRRTLSTQCRGTLLSNLLLAVLVAQSRSHATRPLRCSPDPLDTAGSRELASDGGPAELSYPSNKPAAETLYSHQVSSSVGSKQEERLPSTLLGSSASEPRAVAASGDSRPEPPASASDEAYTGAPCRRPTSSSLSTGSETSARRPRRESTDPVKRQVDLRQESSWSNNKLASLSSQRREDNERDLIELLAQFYAHIEQLKDRVNIYLLSLRQHSPLLKSELTSNQSSPIRAIEQRRAQVEAEMGADQETLLKWLRDKQSKFESLASIKFELLKEAPNKSIIVCQDGPKILVLPNVTDIVRCYPHDQWIERLWLDVKLLPIHYPAIVLSLLIFLFGTTGNVFVCLSVYRNHQLRNVTNYFIVNLAVADLLVIIICLPATVIWDVSLTWFFGTVGCKSIMFLQDVSVSVSVLTLTAISLDRYNAICHPLKFKSNLNQAKRAIIMIWLVSLAIMSPDLLYLNAYGSSELSEAGLDTVLYSDCDYNLTRSSALCFQFVKTILLYLLPFLLMFCTHFKILKTLREVPRSTDELDETEIGPQPTRKLSCSGYLAERCRSFSKSLPLVSGRNSALDKSVSQRVDVCSVDAFKKCTTPASRRPIQSVSDGQNRTQLMLTMNNQAQLESRRKAAKMLTAIVILFGLSYLPVHLINSLRQFIDDIPQTDATLSISMLAHCVCYLNSAINPIIYNYMNSVFRAEFKKFLSCCSVETHLLPASAVNIAGQMRCQLCSQSDIQLLARPNSRSIQPKPSSALGAPLGRLSRQHTCNTLLSMSNSSPCPSYLDETTRIRQLDHNV